MTVAEALREAARQLAPVFDTARLDAELLMCRALSVTRSELLLRHMDRPAPGVFTEMIERRARHEPVAYITGQQEFYGLDFDVTPAVLIPRADSETLIEAARDAFGEDGPRRILDLGTGSGALLLAALSLWPAAEGLGIDRSAEALHVARGNAARSGAGAAFFEGDWHREGWTDPLGRFDLILCNPPYVERGASLDPSVEIWEPAGALFAGPEGLDDYRALIPRLPDLLEPGGVAILEIGATQSEAVGRAARDHGFAAELRLDLGGRPRALLLRLGLGK